MADTPRITGVDWDLVNEDAANWARDYGGKLVKDISTTTRRGVGNAVSNFYTEAQTMGELTGNMTTFRDNLGTVFSPQRAEMIAVTEVTRSAAEGEREMAKELAKEGIIMVEVWQTRNDDLVCEICGPRNGIEELKGSGDAYWDRNMGPPGHPRCRCNVRHELPKPKEGAVEVEGMPRDAAMVDFRTREEAIEGLRARSINRGIRPNGTDLYEDFDFTLDEANRIANALDNTVDKYGIGFDGIYKTDVFDSNSIMMDVVPYKGTNTIRVNKNFDYSLLEKNIVRYNETGQYGLLATDFDDALYHELGHTAAHSGTDKSILMENLFDNNKHVLSAVSRYSTVNADEMVAEAFLNVEKNINPGAKSLTDYIISTIFGF